VNNIIVTGANGMIGWHVLQQLKGTQNRVWAIDYQFNESLNPAQPQFFKERFASSSQLENVTFVEENLLEQKQLALILLNHRIDTIIHLAAKAGVAESFAKPGVTLLHNQKSLINVLDAVRRYSPKTHVIFASSSSVYGKDTMDCTAEESALNPVSPYGLSKLFNEQTARFYQQHYFLNLTGLRFFTAYGEYNRQDMLVYKIIEAINEQKELKLYHNGMMHRDFTYAGDIARIIHLLSEKKTTPEDYPALKIFNVGKGHSESISYMVQLCEQYLGKKANTQIVDHHPSYDPLITYADNRKILNYLNDDFAFTSIEEGLKKTMTWFEQLQS
jgi:UDP-glucuronate 4-epimerase